MLMGTLPTFANAKDDAYVIYAEDGVHCLKMKREYFTADIEQLGCDYWKEGSGVEIKNPGGTHVPIEEDTKIACYTRYTTNKAKTYRHAGDFWVCFKLREGESIVNSDYFVCGNRSYIDRDYFTDPGSAYLCLMDGISKINNYPVYIYWYPGNAWYSNREFVYSIASSGSALDPEWDNYHIFENTSSVYAHKTAMSFDKVMNYGFHGLQQAGTMFSGNFIYKDDLSSALGYIDSPPCGTGCDYAQWVDPDVQAAVAEYFDINTVYDSPLPFGTNSAHLSGLLNDTHYWYKMCLDDTAIQSPSSLGPSFIHVLNILKPGQNPTVGVGTKSFVRPKGVLCSIPVVGVESYTNPIYPNIHNRYTGYSNVMYFSIAHPVWGTSDYWYEYRISKSYWPMASGEGYAMVNQNPYYYVNDFESEYIHHNYIAISRKGIRIMTKSRGKDELLTYRATNPPTTGVTYIDSQGNMQFHTLEEGETFDFQQHGGRIDRWLNIGNKTFMRVSDVDGLQYGAADSYLDMGYEQNGGPGGQVTLLSDIWDIEKTNAHPWEYNSVPIESDFYVLSTGDNYVAFKDRYTIPFTFDSNTIKVTHITPQSGVDYDLISLKTLWKMTLKVNNETKFILDTNYNGTRPSEMNLNFNPNQTKNYGFGDEFTIDTVNSDISLSGFRVDSNTVRTAGTKSIRANSIVMRDNTGKYQSIRMINSESSSIVARQANTSAKFRPEELYFCNWQISSNSTITNSNTGKSPLYKSYKKVSINDISGYAKPYNAGARGNLYLVGSITSDGYFQVVSNASSSSTGRNGFITDKLPTTADGYYYIFLGEFDTIDSTPYFSFAEVNPIYYYKNGRIQQYHYGEPSKYPADFLAWSSHGQTPVSVKNDDDSVIFNFDNHFNNTYNQTTGLLTLALDTSTLPDLSVDSFIFTDTDVVTDVAANTLTKVDDIQGLKFNNSSRKAYVDISVIFKTHDGSAMTDGVFEARLNYSQTLNNFICGVPGPKMNCSGGGYYNQRTNYVSGESEVVVRMRGFVYDGQSIGASYPYIVVQHTCSTNIDVDYCINGYMVS